MFTTENRPNVEINYRGQTRKRIDGFWIIPVQPGQVWPTWDVRVTDPQAIAEMDAFAAQMT